MEGLSQSCWDLICAVSSLGSSTLSYLQSCEPASLSLVCVSACVHCVDSWLQLCYFCLQACNYWTRAAAFSQCLRQCSTLIGFRKSRKMSLSWSMSKILPPLFSQTHVGSVSDEGRVWGISFTSLITGIPLGSGSSRQSNSVDFFCVQELKDKGLMTAQMSPSLAQRLAPVFLFCFLESRRCREDSAPTRRFPSAIQRWLVIYRSQNRAERLLERPGVVGPSHARIQENTAEVDLEEWAKKWLG